MDDFMEHIAEKLHDIWAKDMDHALRNFGEENVRRWQKQIVTPYPELPDEEKAFYRKQAHEMLPLMLANLTAVRMRKFSPGEGDVLVMIVDNTEVATLEALRNHIQELLLTSGIRTSVICGSFGALPLMFTEEVMNQAGWYRREQDEGRELDEDVPTVEEGS
jgi:hypothetical protein